MKKNVLFIIIILNIVSLKNVLAQNYDENYKQMILSVLDSSNSVMDLEWATDCVQLYQIVEAIPILEDRFWSVPLNRQRGFLEAMAELNSINTVQYALAFIDSVDSIKHYDSLIIKLDVTSSLFKVNNYSTAKYIFEWLDEYHKGNLSEGIFAIQMFPKLLEIPEYETRIKQELIYICKNENDLPDYRLTAIDILVNKYGSEFIPLLLERLREDTTSHVRYNAFRNLGKLNYEGLHNLIIERLPLETEFIFRIFYADTLLKKYGHPSDYYFLDNYLSSENNPKAKEMIGLYTQYQKPPKIALSTEIIDNIDSLISYSNQLYTFEWIGDGDFVYNLTTILGEAKNRILNSDSLLCREQILLYQQKVINVFKDSMDLNPEFVLRKGWNILYNNAQYILDRLPEPPANPNLVVNLKSSTGTLLTTGSLQYYEGSWKDAVNNGDGTFTVLTNQNNVSLRMTYEYGQQTVNNIPAHNNTYTFQTISANVQLKNSQGSFIDTGTVQYYAGAWRSFGITTNGVAAKELLPINYSFRITYGYASIDKQQNLSVDPTVVFQTVNASVQLKNSLGNLIDQGSVQYYAGAWRTFGTTSNGVAIKELLPINYSFRMTYAYASIDKQQNLSVDPTVVFQTVNAAVQLKNSLGNLIDQGTVQYYAGAWRSFGTTSNGVATKELLPINYSFRMIHAFLSKDKQQNLSTNPVVDFTTVLCSVKVSRTNNQPISNANVKYYAGAWRDLGITNAEGITAKELLPQNISFRASYGNVSLDKQQDIGANSLVEILLNVP